MMGFEEFSHLEDKIHRTVELCKALRLEKESLERELEEARKEIAALRGENSDLEKQAERMLSDREAMQLKVEAMLDAIAMLEMEAESVKK
ncbi:MAG: cell division protein ZapB [Blastocatellia bacterium]|nr:cell division protein ZapB [Blastocatellia bacterium]